MCAAIGALLHATDLPDWKRPFWPSSERWRAVEQSFVFTNEAEPQGLDPALVTGVPESRLMLALFEGLVGYDPVTLAARPGVAERWEVSPDGRVYTFHLRADARWSDGVRLTADDVRDSWLRVIAPDSRADYAYQLFPILGAEDYHAGRIADASQVGIAVVNEGVLRVVLRQPCAWFLDLVAFHTLAPVPLRVVRAHGDRWTMPEHMVSNGPYRLVRWLPRQEIVLERNEHYWDRDFVKLARITALPITDTETAWKLFQQGALHWMPKLPTAKLDEIRRLPEYQVAPYFGTYFYRFNCTRPPFDDARVRRAFALAIDRDAIADQVLRGVEQPASAFCPPVVGYQPEALQTYDRDGARRLLREAGYGPQRPLPPIELLFNSDERHRQVAEAVAQQWQDVLGARVALRNSEWKTYLSAMNALDYQVVRASWVGDYNDPNTFLDLFVTDGGNNRTGWSDPRYDALLATAQAEPDHARRLDRYHELERLLLTDGCPIAVVYRYVAQALVSERVAGWRGNLRDLHPFQYLWME